MAVVRLEPNKWYAVVMDSYGNIVIADTMEKALDEYEKEVKLWFDGVDDEAHEEDSP